MTPTRIGRGDGDSLSSAGNAGRTPADRQTAQSRSARPTFPTANGIPKRPRMAFILCPFRGPGVPFGLGSV